MAGRLAARLALPIARGDRVAETQSYMALEKSRNHVDACEPALLNESASCWLRATDPTGVAKRKGKARQKRQEEITVVLARWCVL